MRSASSSVDVEKLADIVSDATVDLLEEVAAARIERVVEIEDPRVDFGESAKVARSVRRYGFDGQVHFHQYRLARLRLHRLKEVGAFSPAREYRGRNATMLRERNEARGVRRKKPHLCFQEDLFMRFTQTAAAAALLALAFGGPAFAEETKFMAMLTAAEEVPPTNSAGTGTADITWNSDTKELTWTIEFSGLSGPATAAHFHGPADPGANAGPQVPITGLESPSTGTATLTDAQAAGTRRWQMVREYPHRAAPGRRDPRSGCGRDVGGSPRLGHRLNSAPCFMRCWGRARWRSARAAR